MPNFIKDVQELRQRAIRNIEEGAVTEAYELDPERSIAILNDALATEIVCVLRYLHHYFMATGVHAQAVSNEFKEHADAEREHADELAERIQQLGGKPDFNPRTLLERSVSQYVEGETLGDMIREDLIAERVVIDVYSQMIRYFGEKDPTTRVLLEHILSEEEEHASDLSDLLYIVEPSTGETEGEDPGVHPLQSREQNRRQREEQRYEQDEHAGSGQPQRVAQARGQSQGNQGAMASRGGMGGHTAKGDSGRNLQQREGDRNLSGRSPRNAAPEQDAGTVARRRNNEEPVDLGSDRKNEGAMGGGTRAVRVTNKNRKNRAA